MIGPNYLAFAVPLFSLNNAFAFLNPTTYEDLERCAASPLQEEAHAIAIVIFNAIAKAGSDHEHYDRLQELLEGLPEDSRSVEALVRSHIHVVDIPEEVRGAGSTGVDENYYITIDPRVPKEALPFIIGHELSHFLNEDSFGKGLLKAASSFAVTFCTVVILKWTLAAALAAAILTNVIVHCTYSIASENWADDFALSQLLVDTERKAAVAFLDQMNKTVESLWKTRILNWLTYPSHARRIAKINSRPTAA